MTLRSNPHLLPSASASRCAQCLRSTIVPMKPQKTFVLFALVTCLLSAATATAKELVDFTIVDRVQFSVPAEWPVIANKSTSEKTVFAFQIPNAADKDKSFSHCYRSEDRSGQRCFSKASVGYQPKRAGEKPRRRLGVQHILGAPTFDPGFVRDLGLSSHDRRLRRFCSHGVASPSEKSQRLR
jgi:hypothetical protein